MDTKIRLYPTDWSVGITILDMHESLTSNFETVHMRDGIAATLPQQVNGQRSGTDHPCSSAGFYVTKVNLPSHNGDDLRANPGIHYFSPLHCRRNANTFSSNHQPFLPDFTAFFLTHFLSLLPVTVLFALGRL